MPLNPIIISDLDGTLVLTDPAVRAASMEVLGRALDRDQTRKLPSGIEGRIHYLYQTKYSGLIAPNTDFLPTYFEYARRGHPMIILTARLSSIDGATKALLHRLGIPYTRLITRDEPYISDEEYKAAALESLIARNPKSTFIYYDDRLENLSFVARKLRDKDIALYHVRPQGIKRMKR